tara:strand:- start:63 stop:410 length:348 start_codon:yes stop_codon:yes gene_type:complete
MPGPVSRKGDVLVTGHGCDGFTVLAVPFQATVFALGMLVARIGDITVEHLITCGPNCCPHVAWVNTGEPTVLTSGIMTATTGHSADLGQMVTGAMTVWAGGGGSVDGQVPLGPGF